MRRIAPWGNTIGVLVFLAILLISLYWPDPKNEAVAYSLVAAAYNTARFGKSEDIAHSNQWQDCERRFGRVLQWRIRGDRRVFLEYAVWAFDVDVIRERAITRERVVAYAGMTKYTGYSSGIDRIEVVSFQPRGNGR